MAESCDVPSAGRDYRSGEVSPVIPFLAGISRHSGRLQALGSHLNLPVLELLYMEVPAPVPDTVNAPPMKWIMAT
jgi:hypothetical protein